MSPVSTYHKKLKEALSKPHSNTNVYFETISAAPYTIETHADGVKYNKHTGSSFDSFLEENIPNENTSGYVGLTLDDGIAHFTIGDGVAPLTFDPEGISYEEHIKANQEAEIILKGLKRDLGAEKALRYNQGKLPMHLVPPSAIKALASVLEYGANKYAERNWEKGANYSVPYASLMRHLLAFWSGENTDPESGLPHTYHILMNAAMLVEYEQLDKSLDDRPRKE